VPSDAEIARLTAVYADYRARGLHAGQWAPGHPGNRAIQAERAAALGRLLARHGLLPLGDRPVLEVGCGNGDVLALLRDQLGAAPAALHGVDLLDDEVATARRRHPDLEVRVANAEALPFADARFALVLAFTVFTSILDAGMAARVAAEIARVLRPGGAVVWYDFRWSNPWNPHVRGIGRAGVRALFPGFVPHLHSLTVLPPLARRLGRATPALYPVLARVPPLRTHWLGLLRKPG